MSLVWCCGLFLLPDPLLGGLVHNLQVQRALKRDSHVPSSSFGRGRVRSPQQSPRRTWESAAGCVKDGENLLRNEHYHTVPLGTEVTGQQDSAAFAWSRGSLRGVCRLSHGFLLPFPFQRYQPLCHSQTAPHGHQRSLSTHHPMKKGLWAAKNFSREGGGGEVRML